MQEKRVIKRKKENKHIAFLMRSKKWMWLVQARKQGITINRIWKKAFEEWQRRMSRLYRNIELDKIRQDARIDKRKRNKIKVNKQQSYF